MAQKHTLQGRTGLLPLEILRSEWKRCEGLTREPFSLQLMEHLYFYISLPTKQEPDPDSPTFSQQLFGLSTTICELIKHPDSTSGAPHECFILTLNYLQATNGAKNARGGGEPVSCGKQMSFVQRAHSITVSQLTFHFQQHLPSLQASAFKISLCRMDWVPLLASPGTGPT